MMPKGAVRLFPEDFPEGISDFLSGEALEETCRSTARMKQAMDRHVVLLLFFYCFLPAASFHAPVSSIRYPSGVHAERYMAPNGIAPDVSER